MKKISLFLLLASLMLVGCNRNNDPSGGEKTEPETSETESIEEDVELTAQVGLKGKNKAYNVPVIYKNSMFDMGSDVYSSDLALLAYGASLVSGDKISATSFFNTLKFGDIYFSESYNSEPEKDSIAYTFGHRVFNQNNFVIVSVRGFNYGTEWVSNFNLGVEGPHAGFKESADKVIASLDTYLSEFNNEYPTKVLFTGYSRGGAVANVSADILLSMEDDKKLIPNENFYFYTFETPRGLPEATPYENVFNVINSGDLITHFAPEQYGLYRCGIDVDIYKSNVDELLTAFDSELVLPAFKESEEQFSNESEFIEFLIKNLTDYDASEYKIQTREEFVNVAGPALGYFVYMVMSLKSATTDKIMADIKEKGFSALSIISSGENLYNFLKPYLDEDGFTYDDEELLTHCTEVALLITEGPLQYLLFIAYGASDNLSRVINMHYPEINYALLKEYKVY